MYANSSKQKLSSHLLGVAIRSLQIIDELNLKEDLISKKTNKNLRRDVFLAAILHDIGKTSSQFQSFLSKKRKPQIDPSGEFSAESEREKSKDWNGIFHQETSTLLAKMVFSHYEESVLYAIYWHHKQPVDSSGKPLRINYSEILEEMINNNLPELSEANFISVALDYLYNNVIPLAKELYPESSEYLRSFSNITTEEALLKISKDQIIPKYFDVGTSAYKSKERNEQAYKSLVLSVLIFADRQISGLSAAELEEYIKGNNTFFRPINNRTNLPNLAKMNTKDDRSVQQYNLAQKLSTDKNISICSVDTGAGKTSISILSEATKDDRSKLLIMLPERMQINAMYHSVVKDCNRIFPNNNISIQAVHSGKVVLPENSNQQILEGDINIIIFDRIILSQYDRNNFYEYFSLLTSDLVIDEFHKFNQLELMWPALSVILIIRSWLNKMTILQSATPDLLLIENLTCLSVFNKELSFYKRDNLSPVHEDSKIRFYLDPENGLDLTGGFLRTHNTISEAQTSFLQKSKDGDEIYHSRFTDNENDSDKSVRSKIVLDKFSEKNLSDNDIYAAAGLQASINISRRNGSLPIKSVFETPQELGRILRFGEYQSGNVELRSNIGARKLVYKDNVLGYKESFSSYHDYICDLFTSTDIFNKELNKRDIMSVFFDEYWGLNEYLSSGIPNERMKGYMSEISKYFIESCTDGFQDFPKRYMSDKKKPKSKKGSSGSSLRGESKYVSSIKFNGPLSQFTKSSKCDTIAKCISINSQSFWRYKEKFINQLGETSSDAANLFSNPKVYKYYKWEIGSKDSPLPISTTNNDINIQLRNTFFKNNLKFGVYFSDVGLFFFNQEAWDALPD